MLKKLCSALILTLLSSVALAAPKQYRGSLDPELYIDMGGRVSLKPATDEQKAALPLAVGVEDKVFASSFPLHWEDGAPTYNLVIVQPPKGWPYMYLDVNHNGKFTADERLKFEKNSNWGQLFGPDAEGWEVATSIPLSPAVGRYTQYPVKFRCVLVPPKPQPATQDVTAEKKTAVAGGPKLILNISGVPVATGSINIEGKKTLVRYSLDFKNGKIDPMYRQLWIDSNQDGKIDTRGTSFEVSGGFGEPVVFRVGNHYVATNSVNATTGEIIAEERPASEYMRIELTEGGTIPDFDFKDLSGKPHKLSEFRGKYLILDFWGTWCGPCRAGIEEMQKFYPEFKERGLEILGMDFENHGTKVPTAEEFAEGLKNAQEYVASKGVPWRQTEPASVYDLILKRFAIPSFPTTVVLDPQGKIIGVNWKGEEMRKKLDQVLPQKAAARAAAPPVSAI